jgi:hypothetical protein
VPQDLAARRIGRHEATAAMKLAVQELVVHAPIEQLFELLVDPELFVLWMADDRPHRPARRLQLSPARAPLVPFVPIVAWFAAVDG